MSALDSLRFRGKSSADPELVSSQDRLQVLQEVVPMRGWWNFLLIATLALFAGCKNIGKKDSFTPDKSSASGGGTPNANDRFWEEPASAPGFGPGGSKTSGADGDAILAGQVVDPSGRGLGKVFVQVVAVQPDTTSPVTPTGKTPKGVETDENGHFVLPGLERNKTYQISAQKTVDGRTIGRVMQLRAPFSTVLLRLTEDGMSSLMLPPQSPPTKTPWPTPASADSSSDAASSQPPASSSDPLIGGTPTAPPPKPKISAPVDPLLASPPAPTVSVSSPNSPAAPMPTISSPNPAAPPPPPTTPPMAPPPSPTTTPGSTTPPPPDPVPLPAEDAAFAPGRTQPAKPPRPVPPTPRSVRLSEIAGSQDALTRPIPANIRGPGGTTELPPSPVPTPRFPTPPAPSMQPQNTNSNPPPAPLNVPTSAPVHNGSIVPVTPPAPMLAVGTDAPGSTLGKQVEPFVLYDASGRKWDSRSAQGRLILVCFSASWCGPCRQTMPKIDQLAGTYRNWGLETIVIQCDEGAWPIRSARAADRKSRHLLYLLEGEGEWGKVQKAFGVHAYPHLALIDREGHILWEGNSTNLAVLETELRHRLR